MLARIRCRDGRGRDHGRGRRGGLGRRCGGAGSDGRAARYSFARFAASPEIGTERPFGLLSRRAAVSIAAPIRHISLRSLATVLPVGVAEMGREPGQLHRVDAAGDLPLLLVLVIVNVLKHERQGVRLPSGRRFREVAQGHGEVLPALHPLFVAVAGGLPARDPHDGERRSAASRPSPRGSPSGPGRKYGKTRNAPRATSAAGIERDELEDRLGDGLPLVARDQRRPDRSTPSRTGSRPRPPGRRTGPDRPTAAGRPAPVHRRVGAQDRPAEVAAGEELGGGEDERLHPEARAVFGGEEHPAHAGVSLAAGRGYRNRFG